MEFALILPIAITLYLGAVQLQDGIACNRKVTITARSTADLIAQSVTGTTTASEIDSNLAAATAVMTPYPQSRTTIRVTEVSTDALLRTTVQWSRSTAATAYPKGQIVTIPTGMRIPGTYFLYAEVTYAYKPAVVYSFIGPLTLRDSIYMLPRNASRIDCNDC